MNRHRCYLHTEKEEKCNPRQDPKREFFFQKHHMIRSWKWRVLRALCARACQPLRVRDRRPSHSYSKQKEDFFKYVHQFYFGRDAVF